MLLLFAMLRSVLLLCSVVRVTSCSRLPREFALVLALISSPVRAICTNRTGKFEIQRATRVRDAVIYVHVHANGNENGPQVHKPFSWNVQGACLGLAASPYRPSVAVDRDRTGTVD